MIIGSIEYEQIIVTNKDGEVLAIISDNEIIEHENIVIILDEKEGD